jgi:hypothetical protein
LASSALSALVTMAFAAGAEPADESTSSEHFRNAESADTAEVVVTAQRRKERLSDVGMTIASVDGELLNERRIDTAADLTQVVSALSVAENADGTPVYTLRGVGFNSTSLGAQPTVSIYQDEAPLPYGPMTQGLLFDLERRGCSDNRGMGVCRGEEWVESDMWRHDGHQTVDPEGGRHEYNGYIGPAAAEDGQQKGMAYFETVIIGSYPRYGFVAGGPMPVTLLPIA